MKKTTGKVVSLVLALALVVTSFSGTFAFAATKSVAGTVSADKDAIYLANGDSDNNSVNIKGWIIPELDTKDHQDVDTTVDITAISHSSGDSLVKWDIDSDTGEAELTVKSTTKYGTEVLSVLYESTYSNDDGDDVTVKARRNFTVNVLDIGSIVIGKVYDSNAADLQAIDSEDNRTGKELEAPATFAQTKNSKQNLGVYEVSVGADAKAVYTPVKVTTKTAAEDLDGSAYSVSSTGDVHLTADGSKLITATVGKGTIKDDKYPNDGSVANVTITAKKIIDNEVSSDSDDKYTLKTKVEKKVDVAQAMDNTDGATGTEFTIDTDKGTQLYAGAKNIATVTDAEIVFPSSTTKINANDGSVKKISGGASVLEINDDASVGEVDLDAGNVTVDGGKVGNITTDGNVTVTSGKAGNIDNTDGVKGNVTVNGGTVGTINSDGEVAIASTDEDTAITTGAITAQKVIAFSQEAKVVINGIKINAADGSVTLKGDDTVAGTIDFDYRNAALYLGDDDDAFTGTVSAPVNAVNGKIVTENEDTDATVTGAVNVDSISVGSDTKVAFGGAITVDSIDGDGSLKIAAGNLYVTGSLSGVTLKLSNTTLAVGTTVLKADEDTVDVDDFTPYGFTLDKSNGSNVDTFKIKTLSFAGLAINKTASSIAKGYSETFTASAYPGGTSLPAGATITWDFDGSDDVFAVTTTANTATVKVLKVDTDFTSENKGTLTATLYDADGYELDDYDAATTEVTAIAVPLATSDTTSNFSVATGATYQFKITSTTVPAFNVGTAGVFTVALASHTGNDYFYKITAIGKVGSATGIFLNGTKLLVATVKAPAFTSDTHGNVTVKGAYTVKITATATPTFALGTAGVFKAAFVSKTGNNYLYKITSASAVGTKAGIYVNGALTFVGIVG